MYLKKNLYNNIIEKTIGNIKGDIINANLKNIGKEFKYDINKDIRKRLNKRIILVYLIYRWSFSIIKIYVSKKSFKKRYY